MGNIPSILALILFIFEIGFECRPYRVRASEAELGRSVRDPILRCEDAVGRTFKLARLVVGLVSAFAPGLNDKAFGDDSLDLLFDLGDLLFAVVIDLLERFLYLVDLDKDAKVKGARAKTARSRNGAE